MNGNNYARITEYRQADFNRRLHMYFQYPRLRAEFILIDQAELNTTASLKARKHSPANKVTEILGSVSASVKRIFGIASA